MVAPAGEFADPGVIWKIGTALVTARLAVWLSRVTARGVTLDNQTASLAVTKAVPIFQITPGSANSPAGATITYTNLGVILHVTPRIAADNNISLKVIPEVSNIDSKDEQTLNGLANTANI